MKIYQTDLTRGLLIPGQLEFLRASKNRGLLRSAKEESLLYNLEKGAAGEQMVLDYFKRYGCDQWTGIQNLWLDQYGTYENDFVLLTNHTVYEFEIKNYAGLFQYKNSRCYINGRKSKENPIQQAEKSLMNIRDICRKINSSIPVKGALIFIGEHNEVEIHSEVDGIQVVTRSGLRKYIQSIVDEEAAYPYPPTNSQQLITHFEKQEVANPFNPTTSFQPEDLLKGRRGIYCRQCFSYDIQTTRKFVKCKCGFVELRREAIIRTIYEFCALTFDNNYMLRKDLMAFMDGQTKTNLLIEILNQHFDPIKKSRYTKYPNKKKFLDI